MILAKSRETVTLTYLLPKKDSNLVKMSGLQVEETKSSGTVPIFVGK
ncbi:hypothetical protein ACI7RC_14305 [Brevibacillus sp. B_LB10_24]